MALWVVLPYCILPFGAVNRRSNLLQNVDFIGRDFNPRLRSAAG